MHKNSKSKASKWVKMAVFGPPESMKLISRKIWVARNSWNFRTVYVFNYYLSVQGIFPFKVGSSLAVSASKWTISNWVNVLSQSDNEIKNSMSFSLDAINLCFSIPSKLFQVWEWTHQSLKVSRMLLVLLKRKIWTVSLWLVST